MKLNIFKKAKEIRHNLKVLKTYEQSSYEDKDVYNFYAAFIRLMKEKEKYNLHKAGKYKLYNTSKIISHGINIIDHKYEAQYNSFEHFLSRFKEYECHVYISSFNCDIILAAMERKKSLKKWYDKFCKRLNENKNMEIGHIMISEHYIIFFQNQN